MANAALAGFLNGAVQGYDQQQALEKDRAREKREQTRFDYEQKERERKDQEAQRQEQIRARIQQEQDDFNAGRGDYAQFASPEQQQAQQAGERKSALSYANAEEARLSNYGGQGTTRLDASRDTATPTKQEDNFLKGPLAYKNPTAAEDLYYKRMGALLKEDFSNKGEFGRAMMVDSQMNELREKQYEPSRRAAAAAAVMGASPETLQPLLDKVYGVWKDGGDVKVTGMQVDPKTNLPVYNMRFTNKDTGQSVDRQMNGSQLYGILQSSDAFKVVEFNTKTKLQQQEADAATTAANARMISANADSKMVGIRERALDSDIKAGEQKARVEAVNKFFPLAGSELKPEDRVGTPKERLAERERGIDLDTKGRAVANNLVSLNPKADVRVIAGFSRRVAAGFEPEGTREASTGRHYTMHGGTKIYLD